MFALFAALLFGTAHADDLRIETPDDIHHLTLVCDGVRTDRERAEGTPIAGGKLEFDFPIYPGHKCGVILVQTVGEVEEVGTWSCTSAGCARTDSGPQPIHTIPGEVKLIISSDITNTEAELTCDSGYRSRVTITNHEADFVGVPDGDDCTLNFKGGAPLKYRPVSPGGFDCYLVSGTLLCKAR